MGTAVLHHKIEVRPCLPGFEIGKDRSCTVCTEGTYSTDGRECLPCPTGGVCARNVTLDGIVVLLGVERPYTAPGYFLQHAPPSKLSESVGYCNWNYKKCSKPSHVFDTKFQECKAQKYSAERLFTCVGDGEGRKHFYECPMDSISCNGTSSNPSNYSSCNIGYEGLLCSTCSASYYRASDGSCKSCGALGSAESAIPIYIAVFGFGCLLITVAIAIFLRDDAGASLFRGLLKGKGKSENKSKTKVVPQIEDDEV